MANPTLKFASSDDKIYKDLANNDNFVFQINNEIVATMSQADTTSLSVSGPIQTTSLLEIDQASAPGTTTNKLYNVGGDLFWDGQNMTNNQDSSLIQDGDTNNNRSSN
jgi:hypothetical protein